MLRRIEIRYERNGVLHRLTIPDEMDCDNSKAWALASAIAVLVESAGYDTSKFMEMLNSYIGINE